MNGIRWIVSGILLVVAPFSLAQQQQQNRPHIGYIYPAGGQQGTSFQITVGGEKLDNVSAAEISGEGVKAEIIEYMKPINGKQATILRDSLKELMERKATVRLAERSRGSSTQPATGPATTATWTEEDDKKVAEILKKLATFQRKPSSPAIVERVTIQITMQPDAVPGTRELRLVTPQGVTNPMAFQVSDLPEVGETETKSNVAATDVPLKIPVIVNGQIMPGDVDRWRFNATRGQHIVAVVSARSLIPYIADAVPGWFQATLALYDERGKEVVFVDDFRFNPDPVLHYEFPKDGQYTFEIRDSIYRGREDFVYRITIGQFPFVTSIYPLGGSVEQVTQVVLKGWNLPTLNASMDGKGKSPGTYTLPLNKRILNSNTMLFAIDNLAEIQEQEPNNQLTQAQAIASPVIINGRIDHPGDVDTYKFAGNAGDDLVAEVTARRLNSPVDSMLRITDASGKQLAGNDDSEDKGAGLETHHADSYISYKLQATDTYFVRISDTQQKGGPEYAYRLRISPPRPDFALLAAPSSINLRGGTSTPITVYALRRDGFSGEINMFLKDAPTGFALGGARIPANQNDVRITISAPRTANHEAFALNIEGKATIAGRVVAHEAIPTEDMTQAFAYHHLVPADEMEVTVSNQFAPRAFAKIIGKTPIRIPSGGTVHVPVSMPPGVLTAQMELELSDPPAGVSLVGLSENKGEHEIILKSDAARTRLGAKGNLIINAYASVGGSDKAASANPQRRRLIGTLPAVPFEIIQ